MTTPTSTPGSNIEVDLRATNPRTDFDVSEDYILEAREGTIPDSIIHRWTAKDLSGFNDGDAVSSLSDSEGVFDMSAGGSDSVLYESGGINGNPSLDTQPSGYMEYTGSFTISQPATYSFVVQIINNGDDYFFFTYDTQGRDGWVFKSFETSNYITFAGNDLTNTSFSDTTIPLVGIVVFDGANSLFRLNGNEVKGDMGSRDAANVINFGGLQPSDLRFGEWNMFDSALSGSDITAEENRLKNEWDISF